MNTRPTNRTVASWISADEKYALVALNLKLEQAIPFERFGSTLWVGSGATFKVSPFWRETLGNVYADRVEDCDVFLISKVVSQTPGIKDDEMAKLSRHAINFYNGLLLTGMFGLAHDPVIIAGTPRDTEMNEREYSTLDAPIPLSFRRYPAVPIDAIRQAARFAERINALPSTAQSFGGAWRLNRVLHLYIETRTTSDFLDRIHQFARCVDGLILSGPGQGKSQFKSRTELFIGPKHHDLMGEIYDVRSNVEHLHENRYLEVYDENIRLDLLKKDAIAEYIARSCLARILGEDALWSHFANTSALDAFWKMNPADRRAIWGSPIDPYDAVTDFDPRFINGAMLGKS